MSKERYCHGNRRPAILIVRPGVHVIENTIVPQARHDDFVVPATKLLIWTMDASKELWRKPMAVDKSTRHWEGLYNLVAVTLLESERN